MPTVNQQLIAQRLNLSRATVSRSLANHPAISAETRRLVQDMAAKLGYKQSPGRAARRGKKSRTFTIGVVIGIPRGENTMVTYPHILKGIRDRAEIERVSVDVSYQPPADIATLEGQQALMRQIRNNDWRGAILVHPFPEPAVAMITSRISTVSVLESYNEPGIDIIDTDDAPAILDLVLKLSAAGHRRSDENHRADQNGLAHYGTTSDLSDAGSLVDEARAPANPAREIVAFLCNRKPLPAARNGRKTPLRTRTSAPSGTRRPPRQAVELRTLGKRVQPRAQSRPRGRAAAERLSGELHVSLADPEVRRGL